MIPPELRPSEVDNIHESQKLSEYYMEEKQIVYIVTYSGEQDEESFSGILGVYKNLKDAKKAMSDSITDIKETWKTIDFDNPERWRVGVNEELCYEGYTPYDDYSYEVCIERREVE